MGGERFEIGFGRPFEVHGNAHEREPLPMYDQWLVRHGVRDCRRRQIQHRAESLRREPGERFARWLSRGYKARRDLDHVGRERRGVERERGKRRDEQQRGPA